MPALVLVWTPEHPRLVPPIEIPFLHEALMRRGRGRYRTHLVCGLCGALPCILFLLLPWSQVTLWILLTCGLSSFSCLMAARAARRGSTINMDTARAAAPLVRYQAWVLTRAAAGTWFVLACMIVVGLFQLADLQASIHSAGLVKKAVWAGQVWRLLTCILLHGNPIHFLLNAGALVSLGRLVEATATRYHLALVFLASGLTGSLDSMAFLSATSIGASGGLCGLIGFLAVLGLRRKAILPAGFFRGMVISIGFMVVLGILGYELIDNAAHAGGVLGGIACGLVLIPVSIPGGSSLPLPASRPVRIAGAAAALVLAAGAVVAVWKILRA